MPMACRRNEYGVQTCLAIRAFASGLTVPGFPASASIYERLRRRSSSS
jgi:hypothetical protein